MSLKTMVGNLARHLNCQGLMLRPSRIFVSALLVLAASCTTQLGGNQENNKNSEKPGIGVLPDVPTPRNGTPQSGCGNIPPTGTCSGKVVKMCKDNQVVEVDCPALPKEDGQPAKTCVIDQHEGAVCAAINVPAEKLVAADKPPAENPCASSTSIPVEGVCDTVNDRLIYCDGEKKVTMTWSCGANADCGQKEDGAMSCVPTNQGQASECVDSNGNPVDFDGICEGETLLYCDKDNVLQRYSCEDNPYDDGKRSCNEAVEKPEDVGEGTWADCEKTCDDIPEGGECVTSGTEYADFLWTCENGEAVFTDCFYLFLEAGSCFEVSPGQNDCDFFDEEDPPPPPPPSCTESCLSFDETGRSYFSCENGENAGVKECPFGTRCEGNLLGITCEDIF